MKSLILAAGMGTRLFEKTKEIPKCLVKVNGKPLLEYQLEALRINGIKDIIIVIGHKAEKVREFIAANEKFKVLSIRFVENKEYATTNSSYSFWLAKDEIKGERYIHLNCDILFFPELLKKMIETKHDNVILIDKDVELDDSMEQVVMKGDKIVKMEKENLPNAVGRGSGVAKLSPDSVAWVINRLNDYIDKGDKNQHFYGIIRQAVHHVDFFGMESRDLFFKEINTVEELKKAESAIKQRAEFLGKPNKVIILMCGNPATGKTISAQKVYDGLLAMRNVGLLTTLSIRTALNLTDLNSEEERDKVYKEIAKKADEAFESGKDILILDGNFNKRHRRTAIYSVLAKHKADFYAVLCKVDNEKTILRRMEYRKNNPYSIQDKADTMELYRMIDKTSNPIGEDRVEGKAPKIIEYNTEKQSIGLRNCDNLDKGQKEVVEEIKDSLLPKKTKDRHAQGGYKAVIFDIGGVIQNLRWEIVVNQLMDLKTDLSMDVFRNAFYYKRGDYFDLYETNKMKPGAFWRMVASQLGLSEKAFGRVSKAFTSLYGPINAEITKLIKKLKPRFKLMVMSNSCPELQENVESNDFYSIFDKLYFSHKVGLKKPDRAFFEYVLKKNNLRPEECIFIDDAPRNIDIANELGFRGVLFLSVGQLEEDLKKTLNF